MADIMLAQDRATLQPSSPVNSITGSLVIGLTAFLTVVDLFAAQALLPSLTSHYGVLPAAMGLAVNACTFGMAAAGLGIALFGRRLNRRNGILLSLLLLSVPTALLAHAPNLAVFATLRVVQGLFMASAFSLTLAHLGENCSVTAAAGAFAAYITGNVASNLVGRFFAAFVAEHVGLAGAFYTFAALNLAGAVLVYFTINGMRPEMAREMPGNSGSRSWMAHFRNPALRAAFATGFCILFAFIGTFTFVNFVLVRPPLGISMMQLGIIYLVFLPSIFTTPIAGAAARRLGTRPAMLAALAVAVIGLPMLLSPTIMWVLAGMVLVAVGTFFAQAVATGFVSQAAATDRASASGIYLASYFLGGLVGTAVLGQLFDGAGWAAAVFGVGCALVTAAVLTYCLVLPPAGD